MICKENCIGCQACVEMCPVHAITFCRDSWGEGKAEADSDKCSGCGLCDRICPGINAKLNKAPAEVSAAVSKKHRDTGSSGGIFFEIASAFIANGGVVYGAAFDENLKLVHRRAANCEELMPLCKSKYIHSDMTGIYSAIHADLKAGIRVLFVGTPCQASAVKNLFSQKYDDVLYIADFLCHGTGTQTVFDLCINEAEKSRGGKISDFCFRAKTRKSEHSFSYLLNKNGKQKKVSGYAFEFPYYYSYLKYTIFNNVCYSCSYAKNDRVGDITLGDFWGIQRYEPTLNDQEGVSMLSVNSEKGKRLFSMAANVCDVRSYERGIAAKHNQSYNEPEPYPAKKTELADILKYEGGAALVCALACPNMKKNILWARMPKLLKKTYQRIRGKR